jgi:perosamine synthetase
MSIEQELLKQIRSVLPEGRHFLAEPKLDGNELQYFKECVDTNFVSSVGAFVDRFEVDLQEYTGLERAVVCVNGTAALQICYLLAGVQKDDEVLMPAMTFIATANAATYCGAVPHFIDSNCEDLGLDVVALKNYLHDNVEKRDGYSINKNTGRVIRILVAMHTFGHISPRIEEVARICEDYNITLVEDAAEALGSRLSGKHAGSWGLLSALSFNGNKIMTTGGGGAIVTNDSELGKAAKAITTTAKQPHPWRFFHDKVGYNYRMPNINAAVGCAQMEQLPGFLSAKRKIHNAYREVFESHDDFYILNEPAGAESNYWLATVLLRESHPETLSRCLDFLNKEGVGARPLWDLMCDLPMYKDCPSMPLPNARKLWGQVITLPSSVSLGERL